MIILYPGSFDPITLGHMDLVKRACTMCEKIIVGVAKNHSKAHMFSLEERLELSEAVLTDFDNVEVVPLDGLTVEAAKALGADTLLRGLRAVSDFEYEFQMAAMNRKLNAEIETMFLMPDEKYSYVSSSLVREIARLGGDVSHFLHPIVHDALLSHLKTLPKADN